MVRDDINVLGFLTCEIARKDNEKKNNTGIFIWNFATRKKMLWSKTERRWENASTYC